MIVKKIHIVSWNFDYPPWKCMFIVQCHYVLAPNLPDDLDPCGAVNEDKYNIIIKIGAIFN